MTISLEGLPGSGKTTTAELLAGMIGVDFAHERSADVPFLDDFYRDVERYTFETELCFVLVHYHQYRDLQGSTILDFSPVKDLVFADVNLAGREYELFRSIYDHTSGSCPPPDFAIFLELETKHLLERIEQRGRAYEVGFDGTYLEAVGEGYLRRFEELGDQVGRVRVLRDDTRDDVADAVRTALAELGAL
ncbi:MAG: deoxynucleoside kinase [Actinobacteria bacterium]|nr:deoxynucleoside kinase [Actinomycetota bacterium]